MVKQILRTVHRKTLEAPIKFNAQMLKLLKREYFALAVLNEILETQNLEFFGKTSINSFLKHVTSLLRIKNYLTYKYHDSFEE